MLLAADPRLTAAIDHPVAQLFNVPQAVPAAHPAGDPPSTQVVWVSPTSSNWNVASNWSTDAVPGSGDTVLINQPGVTVTVNDSEAAGQLTITTTNAQSPPTLAITAGYLGVGDGSSLAGNVSIAGGVLFVSGGTVTLAGATSWTAGGSISMGTRLTTPVS